MSPTTVRARTEQEQKSEIVVMIRGKRLTVGGTEESEVDERSVRDSREESLERAVVERNERRRSQEVENEVGVLSSRRLSADSSSLRKRKKTGRGTLVLTALRRVSIRDEV